MTNYSQDLPNFNIRPFKDLPRLAIPVITKDYHLLFQEQDCGISCP